MSQNSVLAVAAVFALLAVGVVAGYALSQHDPSDSSEGVSDDEINAKLAETGRPAKLTLCKKACGIDGGLKLKQGNVVTNCSIGTLLAAEKDELVPQVASMLFG